VKLYYRIGEVAGLVGVEPHVLRYWETEFPSIRPQKSRSGQRVYSRRDVDKLLRVKELLYAQRFTIAGARQRLKEGGTTVGSPNPVTIEAAPDTTPAVQPPPDVDTELARGSLRLRAALLDVRCDVLRMLQGLDVHAERMGRAALSEEESLELGGSGAGGHSPGSLEAAGPYDAEAILQDSRPGQSPRERERPLSRDGNQL
jgi:DNA-binding transcriptional MerR regulator